MIASVAKRLEHHIEEDCNDVAKERGVEHVKLERVGKGWPDRQYFLPGGSILLVEYKQPGRVPDDKQERIHERLRRLGHDVHVITSVSAFSDLLSAVLSREGRAAPAQSD